MGSKEGSTREREVVSENLRWKEDALPRKRLYRLEKETYSLGQKKS